MRYLFCPIEIQACTTSCVCSLFLLTLIRQTQSEVFGEHILSRSSVLPRTSTNERSMKLVVQFLSNRREARKETSTSPKCQLYLFSVFRKIICTKKDFPRWVPQALINDQKEKNTWTHRYTAAIQIRRC